MPHHVIVALPDGRVACADYRQPVVVVMRRVNARLQEAEPDVTAHRRDMGILAGWLDHHPEQACSLLRVDGYAPPCPGHGPAGREPAHHPREYVPDW